MTDGVIPSLRFVRIAEEYLDAVTAIEREAYLEPWTGWAVQVPAGSSAAVGNGYDQGYSAAITNDIAGLPRPGADGKRNIGCHETNLTLATLLWDANASTAGPQDGGGTWNSTTTNWWDGSLNTNWNNASFKSALFGGGGTGGTVTVAAPLALSGLTFFPVKAGPYAITGASLSFSGGATITTLGASPTINAPLTGTNGFIKLGSATLTLAGTNTFTGTTTIQEGTLALAAGATATAALLVVTNTGTLAGSGQFGALVNAGCVSPGSGQFGALSGNTYTQSAAGVLNLEIANVGTNDALSISGPARLAGTLNVTLPNTNYTPRAGDTFRLLSSSGLGGTMFSAVRLPLLSSPNRWALRADDTNVTLSVTSPPTNYDAWASVIPNGLTNYNQSGSGENCPNLLKYATGSNPTNADGLARLQTTLMDGACVLRFNRNPDATDVTLLLETTRDLHRNPSWSPIATNTQGIWTGLADISESATNQPVSVTVRPAVPSAAQSFFRLQVSRP